LRSLEIILTAFSRLV